MATKPKTARPVRANAGVEAWYRNQLEDCITAMHESMVLHIRAAYKRTPPTIGFAQDDVDPTVALQRTMKKWGDHWRKKLDGMSRDLAARFAKKNFRISQTAMKASFREAGFTVKFKPSKGSVSAYRAVLAENVNLIKSIPDQYLKDVESSVWQSVMRGGDLHTLSRTLQKVHGVTSRRAAFIARDQNFKAKAIIENERRKELGITEAIWQHSSAGKVPRPTHVAMNGCRFKLAKGMYDSAVEKNVFPGTEPNCRCSSSAIIPGLDEA